MAYKTAPVLAQHEKDNQDIKEVIENLLAAFSRWDLDSEMGYVSAQYSDTGADGKAVDYDKFKSMAKTLIDNARKKYIDYSISDLQIIKLDFNDQQNQATAEIEFQWKAFNLDLLKDESGKHVRTISLAKEADSWKIIRYKQDRP